MFPSQHRCFQVNNDVSKLINRFSKLLMFPHYISKLFFIGFGVRVFRVNSKTYFISSLSQRKIDEFEKQDFYTGAPKLTCESQNPF